MWSYSLVTLGHFSFQFPSLRLRRSAEGAPLFPGRRRLFLRARLRSHRRRRGGRLSDRSGPLRREQLWDGGSDAQAFRGESANGTGRGSWGERVPFGVRVSAVLRLLTCDAIVRRHLNKFLYVLNSKWLFYFYNKFHWLSKGHDVSILNCICHAGCPLFRRNTDQELVNAEPNGTNSLCKNTVNSCNWN